jgi:hypothetical protein
VRLVRHFLAWRVFQTFKCRISRERLAFPAAERTHPDFHGARRLRRYAGTVLFPCKMGVKRGYHAGFRRAGSLQAFPWHEIKTNGQGARRFFLPQIAASVVS